MIIYKKCPQTLQKKIKWYNLSSFVFVRPETENSNVKISQEIASMQYLNSKASLSQLTPHNKSNEYFTNTDVHEGLNTFASLKISLKLELWIGLWISYSTGSSYLRQTNAPWADRQITSFTYSTSWPILEITYQMNIWLYSLHTVSQPSSLLKQSCNIITKQTWLHSVVLK